MYVELTFPGLLNDSIPGPTFLLEIGKSGDFRGLSNEFKGPREVSKGLQ